MKKISPLSRRFITIYRKEKRNRQQRRTLSIQWRQNGPIRLGSNLKNGNWNNPLESKKLLTFNSMAFEMFSSGGYLFIENARQPYNVRTSGKYFKITSFLITKTTYATWDLFSQTKRYTNKKWSTESRRKHISSQQSTYFDIACDTYLEMFHCHFQKGFHGCGTGGFIITAWIFFSLIDLSPPHLRWLWPNYPN